MAHLAGNPRKRNRKNRARPKARRKSKTFAGNRRRHRHSAVSGNPRRHSRRSRRRKSSALVASNPRHHRRARRNRRMFSRNPFGVTWGSAIGDVGVGLSAFVITRAGPGTLASLMGFNNSGFMGYLANIVFAGGSVWLAQKFFGRGVPALVGGGTAIASRLIDDFTGVEVLDATSYQQLISAGATPTSAAAQSATMTAPAAATTGTSGMGRNFDVKYSLIPRKSMRGMGGQLIPFAATSQPPGQSPIFYSQGGTSSSAVAAAAAPGGVTINATPSAIGPAIGTSGRWGRRRG